MISKGGVSLLCFFKKVSNAVAKLLLHWGFATPSKEKAFALHAPLVLRGHLLPLQTK